MDLTDQATIAEARQYILDNRQTGCRCPVCSANVEIYRRTIHANMAAVLCEMRRYEKTTGADVMHVVKLPGVQRLPRSAASDFSKARWWGLIEQMEGTRDDGSPRNGFWRLTPKGRKFVERKERVVKYALEFKSEPMGFAGEMVSIDDCLGDRFRYEDLFKTQTLFAP